MTLVGWERIQVPRQRPSKANYGNEESNVSSSSSSSRSTSLPVQLCDMGYTKEQRAYAKKHKMALATVGVAACPDLKLGGVEFSGCVTVEERKEIEEFLIDFLNRRAERLCREKPTDSQV